MIPMKAERQTRSVSHALRRLFNVAGARTYGLMTGLVLMLPALGAGCGTFMAHRMIQAPNTYPSWLAAAAPVLLSFNENLLTNAPSRFADVGPPSARLHYRVVEPADYHLQISSTHWMKRGEVRYQFTFRAEPPRTNVWTTCVPQRLFL